MVAACGNFFCFGEWNYGVDKCDLMLQCRSEEELVEIQG